MPYGGMVWWWYHTIPPYPTTISLDLSLPYHPTPILLIIRPPIILMSSSNEFYQCLNPAELECAEGCFSLRNCSACGCAVLPQDIGGDWGDFMDVFFCLLPIMFLVYATIKPNPLPTTTSLPAAALLMYIIRLAYLKADPILVTGSVILGLHEAITPLSIMAGAITLFEAMEATYCLPFMMREIKALTAGHPVAEAML